MPYPLALAYVTRHPIYVISVNVTLHPHPRLSPTLTLLPPSPLILSLHQPKVRLLYSDYAHSLLILLFSFLTAVSYFSFRSLFYPSHS